MCVYIFIHIYLYYDLMRTRTHRYIYIYIIYTNICITIHPRIPAPMSYQLRWTCPAAGWESKCHCEGCRGILCSGASGRGLPWLETMGLAATHSDTSWEKHYYWKSFSEHPSKSHALKHLNARLEVAHGPTHLIYIHILYSSFMFPLIELLPCLRCSRCRTASCGKWEQITSTRPVLAAILERLLLQEIVNQTIGILYHCTTSLLCILECPIFIYVGRAK